MAATEPTGEEALAEQAGTATEEGGTRLVFLFCPPAQKCLSVLAHEVSSQRRA